MQDQIVLARHDRFGLEFGYSLFACLLCLGLPRILLDVFVADSLRTGEAAAGLKISCAAVDRGHLKEWQCPNYVLLDLRTIRGGIKFLFILKRQAGGDEAGAFRFHRCFVQLQQEFYFAVCRHVEGILLESALPVCNNLGSRHEFDSLALERSIGQGNLNGLLCDSADRFRSHQVAGRESPCPFDEHANAETEALSAGDVLNLLLASEDRFIPVAINAYIGVSGAQLFGSRDRNIGQLPLVYTGGFGGFSLNDPRW